ncbi:phosphatase PAP2 family protein [Nocardioides agariphilus]|uniref:Phosphatase PAP2 family protein n=1 Tax=Nocardioides agariphilus TaxID=433664 RepID=A0A930VLM5_9ACTN|nr:phosphatase PAP2 family protein [Nocardioides agariphilus]MBF4766896.1 phosphatase PAP2 family protein [Nocardioides agariphilus]
MTREMVVTLLACSLACFAVVAAFGVVVQQDRSPMDGFDQWGRQAEDWADNHTILLTALRVVEVGFATVGMIAWTTLIVVAVVGRRRYRAAGFAIAVMVVTSVATTGLKLWLRRDRPEWQYTTDLLNTHSFPSGHASSSAALAGILGFLAWSLVGPGPRRTALTVLAIVVWVTVCFDRVLLGRHFPTDVVAGSFLGVGVLLLGIAVFDPARVRVRGRAKPGVDSSGRVAGGR